MLFKKHSSKGSTSIISALIIFSLSVLLIGCPTVPKESVELSYTIGNDLEQIHQSYKLLIQRYFDSLRREINRAIDQVFIPAYINDFVKTGGLIQAAQTQRSDLVEFWARTAVETLDKERRDRLAPINEAERDLLKSVNEAFDRAVRANATITAHLNSIRKVKEVQDEVLESLKLKDLRDQVNNALAEASNKAESITKQINDATEELKEISD